MLTPENVILTLKIAVVAVTLLLLASLVALAGGRYWLHGRINLVFFVLTLSALIGLEVVARFLIKQEVFEEYFKQTEAETALGVHLSFSLPAALLLPFMLYTGLRRRRALHLALAMVFGILWTGTFITGVFFLPHQRP